MKKMNDVFDTPAAKISEFFLPIGITSKEDVD